VEHGGRRVVLRVGDACRIHVDGVEDIEAEWLGALRAAGVACPANLPSSTGAHWVRRGRSDVDEPRVCSMFTWVRGRPLGEHLTAARMRAAGRLLAEVHEQSAEYVPRTPIPRGVYADRVVSFHEENRVLVYESEYGSLFVEAIDRVQRRLDELWRSPPGTPQLLHGDFGPNNVLHSRARPAAIDFQDLQYGFDLQDVAVSLADLRRTAPELIEPFRAGYRDKRPWPDLAPDLDAALTAGRSLNIMNLGLHLQRSGLAHSLDFHGQRVAAWMRGSS
jgi:Ser/Thr protein kinase RdoA (MazF antagonist)